MPKRNLRIVKQDVPIIGICEACNAQFKSFNVDEAERVVTAQFDSHECKSLGASQAAVRIVREATSMTPKQKTLVVDCVLDRSRHRYCFDVALGLGGVVTRSAPGECRRLRSRPVISRPES